MGLEPTTSWATTRCYHQLSYTHRREISAVCIPVTILFGKSKIFKNLHYSAYIF